MKTNKTSHKRIILQTVMLLCLAFVTTIQAQTVIHESDVNATPAAKSALDVQSTTKGILFPNLSTAQMSGIPSPTAGLVVYCRTDGYFNYYNGTNWIKIGRDAGAAATNPTAGTATDKGVGVGLEDPDNSALLHVNANNKGVLLPRMTTAQITAIAAGGTETGMLVYNTTTNKVQYYNAAAWTNVTDGATTAASGGASTAAGVIIGTGTVDASAKLEIKSTVGGFLITRMTTIQRDAIDTPAEGLLIYNTDDNKVQYYVAGNWHGWQ